jgi:exodeoxyribonuclease-5
VATTRARDLLVLPRHSAKLPEKCWARIVDFDLASLPALELKKSKTTVAPDQGRNRQSPAAFAAEAGRIAASGHVLVWQRPSRDEMDTVETPTRVRVFESPEQAEGAAEFAAAPVAGSSARGIMLHKLIEEVLLEEIGSDRAEIERRARELMAQLAIEPADDPAVGISPSELAATVVRTLNFPEIARLRAQLVPERTIYGQQITPDREILVSGITDAVAVDERRRLEKRCQSDSGKSRSLSESNR